VAGSEASRAPRREPARAAAPAEPALRAALSDAGSAVRRYLFGMCGDWDQAEDLAQETLLKAWEKRHSFDGRAGVRTWVFAVARNHWLDRLRRARVRPREQPMSLEPTTNPQDSPPAVAGRGELADAIDRAVARLPEAQREALALRESEGLTFSEIGELLGVPPATVKSRVRYALGKLADELKPFARELEP